jgi:drug/metabolite transporter (DMT)-like permease
MPNPKTFKGIWLVVAGSLVISSYGIWAKLIGSTFQPFYQSWTRSVIICLMILPFLIYGKHLVRIKKEDWKWMWIFIISTSATSAPIYYAFNHMDIGSAYLLFFVGMLLTMALTGFIYFKEKITIIKIIAIILAFIGLFIVFSFSATAFTMLAASLALLNGIASGAEVAISKKLTGYSALYLSLISYGAIFATNGLISLIVRESQRLPELSAAWGFQIIFAFTSFLGFWLLLKGIRYLESSIGGLLSPLEAIFGALLGAVVFGEILGGRMIAGGLLIIIAAALPHLADLYKTHRLTRAKS